jgi:hypothetical protein
MKSHREYFAEAESALQLRVAAVEERERLAAIKEAELNQREEKIRAAIAEAGL